MSALLLTIGLAGRADAAFVSSKCETRGGGTQGNNYVDVCVRLETYSGTNGLPHVRGYGAMDYRGAEPFFHRLEILALHVRVYYPAQGGPQKDYITSNYQDGYGYINLRTNDGFVQQCGYGYKAVMTYRIHWQSGLSRPGRTSIPLAERCDGNHLAVSTRLAPPATVNALR
jgi:hypothetical protein